MSDRENENAESPRDGDVVKMSVLAKMSGVPAATIKHYVREGLLPEPSRTSRNMAYYDVALVPRIQRIKELQRTRFLPLKVIRDVLDGPSADGPDETVSAAVTRALARGSSTERRTRAELSRGGMPSAELTWLEAQGVVGAVKRDGEDGFEGEDLELLRVLGAARRAGLDASMLPMAILPEYARALEALVRVELKLFRQGVVPRAGDGLPELTDAATELSERLVVLLRRKLLLPTLRALVEEERQEPAPPPPPRRKP